MIDTRKLNAKDYLITKEQVAEFIAKKPETSANEFANLLNGNTFELENLKGFINEVTFETVINKQEM